MSLIYETSDTQDVGDHDGDMSETKLTEHQKKILNLIKKTPTNQQSEQYGTKSGLSWDQVRTKIGLSWDEVEKLFIALQEPKSMGELKELHGWSNTTKFKVKFVSPLIEARFVNGRISTAS